MAFCSPATVKTAQSVGFEIISSLGEDGKFLYPKEGLVATILEIQEVDRIPLATDEEKEAHPEHETTGGYLKVVDFKTACAIMWDNMTEEERAAVWDIPNFDPDVFEAITGIKVNPYETEA